MRRRATWRQQLADADTQIDEAEARPGWERRPYLMTAARLVRAVDMMDEPSSPTVRKAWEREVRAAQERIYRLSDEGPHSLADDDDGPMRELYVNDRLGVPSWLASVPRGGLREEVVAALIARAECPRQAVDKKTLGIRVAGDQLLLEAMELILARRRGGPVARRARAARACYEQVRERPTFKPKMQEDR